MNLLEELKANRGMALLLAVLVALYTAVSLWMAYPIWLYCGDDGIYSLAARNVLRGMRPYRDFLYVQMPLMSYVYAAWFAVFGVSIESGRALSIVLSVAGMVLSMAIGHRLGGLRGAAAVALLWVSSPHVISDLMSIKMQPLCHFLLCASLFCVPSLHRGRSLLWAGCSMALMTLALFTRLTLVIPLGVLWVYLAWECRDQLGRFALLVAANLLAIAMFVWFFWADGNMLFGVYQTHKVYWGAAPWSWERLQWTIQGWIGNQLVIVLSFALAIVHFCRRLADRHAWSDLAFPAMVLCSFWAVTLAHWAQVENYPTHMSVITVFPVVFTVVVLRDVIDGLFRQPIASLAAFALATLICLPFNQVTPRLRGLRAGKPDFLTEAVDKIARHAKPGDPLLSFNLELVVNGGYEVYPGCDLSDWSCFPQLPDELVDRYRVTNQQRFFDAIRGGKAPILTFTARDFGIMARGDQQMAAQIQKALDDRWQNVGVVKAYGQFSQDLYIFKNIAAPDAK